MKASEAYTEALSHPDVKSNKYYESLGLALVLNTHGLSKNTATNQAIWQRLRLLKAVSETGNARAHRRLAFYYGTAG